LRVWGCVMWRFVLVSFVFLGWAFYEMSGGADYRPAPGSLQADATRHSPEERMAGDVSQPGSHAAPETEGLVLASGGREEQPQRHAVRPLEAGLRLGPGEGYGRLARLERHDEVVVLRAPGEGWVRVRVATTGQEGWMRDGLLYRVP